MEARNFAQSQALHRLTFKRVPQEMITKASPPVCLKVTILEHDFDYIIRIRCGIRVCHRGGLRGGFLTRPEGIAKATASTSLTSAFADRFTSCADTAVAMAATQIVLRWNGVAHGRELHLKSFTLDFQSF